MNIFDVIETIPQRNEIYSTVDGKIRVVGIRETWSGERLVLYADPKRYLKGATIPEFNELITGQAQMTITQALEQISIN